MIKHYPFESLGHADHGWLNARHHFSFANYHNPERMGFGMLRVINDDHIAAKKGFDTHPHQNMEIITYVRKGTITHEDNTGNVGRTEAGDVQVMSAGSGIAHSEYNLEEEETSIYQIWIQPHTQNVEPRWDMQAFPKEPISDHLPLLVSGRQEDNALFIYQDAYIYGGRLLQGTIISHPIKHQAYLLLSEGEIECDGQRIKRGDGAEITDCQTIEIKALQDSEILIIDVPT